jgi:tetratricopeptide (TPR) repeat protein
VVREPGGLVGSADRRFAVRALDGPSLECADLVLSTSRGDLPVRPTAYTGDGLSGVLEVYARTEEQLREAQVIVELLPLDDDAAEPAPAISGHAELLNVRTTSRGVTREARLDLPLQSVLPGAYVARARIMVGPDTVSQTVREVDIRGGRRPEPAVSNASYERGHALAFDSQAIVESATARDFVAHLDQTSSPALADARTGLARLRSADFAGAITAFETVLQQDGANAPAAFLMGWAFHGAGQDREAVSAWRRAAFLDPTLVPAHLALADLYVHLSQPALAVQALRAGLIALPQSPELLDRLSRLEHR